MLGIAFIILTTYCLAKMRIFEINLQTFTSDSAVIILILLTTAFFWLLHALISTDKSVGRYGDNWEEDGIRIVRGISVCLQAGAYLLVTINMDKGLPLLNNMWMLFTPIIILNIAQIILIDYWYSDSHRELAVDAILMEIQDSRNALCVVLSIICAMSWTIVGCLFLIFFVSIILPS